MGKNMVTICMTMMPGASLDIASQLAYTRYRRFVRVSTYHIGGTHRMFTGLNLMQNTAAIQSGVPGNPEITLNHVPSLQ